MITYRFEAKCDRCGHETRAGGPLNDRRHAEKEMEQFIALLSDLGWRLEYINGQMILICSICAAKSLRSAFN